MNDLLCYSHSNEAYEEINFAAVTIELSQLMPYTYAIIVMVHQI